jgi:hypothetical protein
MQNECETEIENKGLMKKKTKRGKTSQYTDKSMTSCMEKLEEIKKQIKRIELMLRSLENDYITCDQLIEMKENLENYLKDMDNEFAKSIWNSVRASLFKI